MHGKVGKTGSRRLREGGSREQRGDRREMTIMYRGGERGGVGEKLKR